MNRILGIACLFFGLCALTLVGCGSVTSQSMPAYEIPSPDLPGAPKIPRLSVLRPYCETKLGNIDAGSSAATAFVAKLADHPAVVVTVLSLLSKANGLSRDVIAGEQSEIVTGVTLGSVFGEIDSVIMADRVLTTPPSVGNMLAIALPSSALDRVGTLSLVNELPAVGTKVWLSAALYAGAPASQRQHSAVITGVDKSGNLTYKFDNSTISFQGTAGAPVLDQAGDVVAIHLDGSLDGETLTGYGNPTATWLPYLHTALKQNQP